MAKIYSSVLELIGHTPLVEVQNFEKELDLKARLLVKFENFNPAGSAKDRVGKAMIDDAEAKGILKPGSVIIEPTSGNTGIGLASVATIKGYKLILTMPDTMSVERINILKAYGAQIVLTKGELGMAGAIDKANEIAANTPDSFIAGQFDNPANPKAHYETTGPEIWEDTDGAVDYLVATIGTGGTITGTGKYLKEKNPQMKVIGVEPETSPLLSKGYAGAHKIQGIGANFIPSVLDTDLLDEVLTVNNEDCFTYSKLLTKKEGVLVGISAGAALKAACDVASREENKGKTIVVILPDSGDRYYSTPLFQE